LLPVALSFTVTLGQWVTTGTDTLPAGRTTHKFLTMQSLAIDSAGTLHAAWIEQVGTGPKFIMYSRKPPDSAWTEPERVAETTANHVSLAVEPSSGRAHIAYQFQWGSIEDLCYATNRTGSWQYYRLTRDTVYDHLPALALEQESLAHIAWITLDPGRAYRIAYITNRTGSWQRQLLSQSQLGGFGLGAAPWLSLQPDGSAHVTYRGGDYPDYHVHHAENRFAGDTVWSYEVLSSGNPYDYTSASAAKESGELFVVVSGDEGWGMPCHTYYLHRPPGSNQWDQFQLMTASASASLRGFAMDGRFSHATWELINGNIRTEKLYHCSNVSGHWFNSPIREDGRTSGGAIVIDQNRCGHCLVLVRITNDSSLVCCLHSAPFTAIAQPPVPTEPCARASIVRPPCRLNCAPLNPGPARLYSVTGELMTTFTSPEPFWNGTDRYGRPVPAGSYLLVAGTTIHHLVILK